LDELANEVKNEKKIRISTENIDSKIFETADRIDQRFDRELKPFWTEESERISRFIGVPGIPTNKGLETYSYNIQGEQTEHPEKGVKTRSARLYPSKSEHEHLQSDIGIFRWYCNFVRDVLMSSYNTFQKQKHELSEKAYRKLFPGEPTKGELLQKHKRECAKLTEQHEIKVKLAKRGTVVQTRKANEKELKALKRQHYQKLKEFDKNLQKVKKLKEYKDILKSLRSEDLFCKMTSGEKGSQLSLFSVRKVIKYITIIGETVNSFGQRISIIEYDPERTEGIYKPSWAENMKINDRIIRGAIKITVATFKSAMTNLYHGNISHFDFSRHLSKKDFNILHIEDFSVPQYIKNMKIKGKQGETIEWNRGCTIKYNKEEKSYILYHFTRFIPKHTKQQAGVMDMKKDVITAIDPGIINSQTLYNFNGPRKESFVEVESFVKQTPKVKELLVRSDELKSKLAKFKEEKQHTPQRICEGVRRKMLKINQKIHNIILDRNKKLAHRLTEENDHILLPDFRVKEIAKRTNLQSEHKRILYLSQFFGFRQFLEHKCNVTGTNLYIVTEEYTSQTCSICGSMDHTPFDKARVHKCLDCNSVLDRDVNGARNILIKDLYPAD